MATIKDVARLAGVSTATVSHVINGSRGVGVEATKNVRQAIKTLKYRPHGIARSLRVKESGTIAVLISDIGNPFFADFVRGVEDGTHASDPRYNLLLCNTDESEERERRSLDLVMERRIDGIVITPAGGNQSVIADLIESGVPMVFGDRLLPGVAADSVVVNNTAAAVQMTQHLLALGHTRIAVLAADLASSAIAERVAGFVATMDKAGLAVPPELVLTSPSTIEDATRVASALLDLAERPSAVYCTSNFMTLGMLRAMAERGLDCPGDLAVVGFDDFEWAEAFRPRLTVIAQPAYRLGYEAATLLFDRMSGRRTGPAIEIMLETSLIVRESCGTISSPA